MRRSREQMFPLIKSWESSGLTRAAFCQQHNLQMGTFTYWRKKYLASTGSSSSVQNAERGFVAIQVSPSNSLANQQPILELRIGSGQLHFYQLPSVDWLAQLLG